MIVKKERTLVYSSFFIDGHHRVNAIYVALALSFNALTNASAHQ